MVDTTDLKSVDLYRS